MDAIAFHSEHQMLPTNDDKCLKIRVVYDFVAFKYRLLHIIA